MSRKLPAFAALGLFIALGVAAPVGIDIATGDLTIQSAEARRGRGADDGANHDVGDDHGGASGFDSGNQRRRGR